MENKINEIISTIRFKIKSQHKLVLREKCKNITSEQIIKIGLLKLKSPILAFLLGALGFLGIDRFYQGKYQLGFLKLSLYILAWVFGNYNSLLGAQLCGISCGILVLYDVIVVWQEIQKENFCKILVVLENN